MELITFENVGYSYGEQHPALQNITISINQGQKVAILGPNGAGKSTLFHLLNGLILPRTGSVTVDGLEVRRENLRQIRRSVGLVFQDPDDQLFNATVRQEVAYGLVNMRIAGKELEDRIEWALDRVGMRGFDLRSPQSLSGGERKRIAIASVLVMKPKILVLDEPTSALDPKGVSQLIDLLNSIHREFGMTLIFATHDVDSVPLLADQVCLLSEGRLVASGATEEVFARKDLIRQIDLRLPRVAHLAELLERDGALSFGCLPLTIGQAKYAIENKVGAILSSFLSIAELYAASSGAANGKLSVVASFDAMAEFVRAVGGDKVEVTTLTSAGTEPHGFEIKAQDMVTLSKAAVFVYNGLGMKAWAEKAIAAAANNKLVAVKASDGAAPIANTDPDKVKGHGQYDPHLWLSLSGAALEAKNIAAALSKVDPTNSAYYKTNLDAFTKTLDELRTEYASKYQSQKRRSFVTGHAAFAYFCRDFGLEQNSVEDVFAEGEPGAKGLASLVEYCRKNDIKTIFVEDMVSPAVSKTLASEVGAKVETIATCEGPEDGKTYLERQRDNLEKVYAALAQ